MRCIFQLLPNKHRSSIKIVEARASVAAGMTMTKLMEWFFGISMFITVWAALLSGQFALIDKSQEIHVLLLPIYIVILFGLYATAVVIYRVFTFNDCEEASEELKRQINEAKQDLILKGFQFT
ncbi:dolichol-phosphate mannosyltransferase subunit 3-like [Varroa jacobsoni]|uniref:dolichol-phosphate mannosyltransferase subunit 3-like n=1 Tax=Varroa jacobsoni TaxID=62625 RepID=UPI000BF9C396|nr:dolichol-phosphate mannosyltransferase subunit 3-like [Varroa jacobsoni]